MKNMPLRQKYCLMTILTLILTQQIFRVFNFWGSIDFGHIFSHFLFFTTMTNSFRGFEPGNPHNYAHDSPLQSVFRRYHSTELFAYLTTSLVQSTLVQSCLVLSQ